MENVDWVCAAGLVERLWVWRRNGVMRKLRKAVRVVGRARDCARRSLAKAMLPLEEMNFGVTVSFVRLVERRALVSIKMAQRWIEI